MKYCGYCGSLMQEMFGGPNCMNEKCPHLLSWRRYDENYHREMGDGPVDYGAWKKPNKKYDENTGEMK